MPAAAKTAQLQIRVSRTEKLAIQRAAARAGLDLSAFVLGRVSSRSQLQFQQTVARLGAATADDARFLLAELNSLLSELTVAELRDAVAESSATSLTPYLANYVAAMVESACARRGLPLPNWLKAVAPLAEPVFGSALQSLRLYLLVHSPAAFRCRNIFIDATIGNQV